MTRALFAFALLVAAAGAAPYKTGDTVVVIRESAVKVGTNTVDTVYPGFKAEVEAVQGDFLWVNLGTAGWIHKNNVVPLNDAIAYFTQQIRQNPSAELYKARASVWSRQQNYENALADMNEAIRLDPQYAALYNDRGLVWLDKGEVDKAIADFTQSLRLEPQSYGYANRGDAWFAKSDYDLAIADYNEAIRLEPNAQFAWYGRGS
ncbi:MAG TPA: tetratricopeptide repeat protein, partial [Pirellulales bacterium]|nr:tetratricopeptide repeat protein [Pirellulales bacterium]